MGNLFGDKNNTTTQQTQYPAYINSALQSTFGQAQAAANTPYQPYGGQQVAPFSDLQNTAFNGITGAANAANPFINQAASMVNNGTQPVTPQAWSPGAVQQYESPYTSDVVNATQNQFNSQNAQQQAALTGNAASNHALGGDRSAIAAAQLAGQQQIAQAPVIAGLNNANFQQATNEFNTQQQTGLAAGQANNYINLYGAGELGNLGQLAQGTGLAGAGALLQAGGLQQQQNQANLNVPYQNYLTAQQYPFYTSGFLSSALGGNASAYAGNRVTTTPGPSTASQIAGLGTTFAGLGGFSSNTNLPLGGVFNKGGATGLRAYAQGGNKDDKTTSAFPNIPDFYTPPGPTNSDYAHAALGAVGNFVPAAGLANAGWNLVNGYQQATDPSRENFVASDRPDVPQFTHNQWLNGALSGDTSLGAGIGRTLGNVVNWFNKPPDTPIPTYSNTPSDSAAPNFSGPPNPVTSDGFPSGDMAPPSYQIEAPNIQPTGLSAADLNQLSQLPQIPQDTGGDGGGSGGSGDSVAPDDSAAFWANGGNAPNIGGADAFNSIGLSPMYTGDFGGAGGGGGGFGGNAIGGGGPDNNGGWGQARGGKIGYATGGGLRAFADGGADDLDDADTDWLMQDDPDENDNTMGPELANATSFLSQAGGLTSAPPPPPAPVQGGGEGASGEDPEGNPMGSTAPAPAAGLAAARPASRYAGGIDPAHQALIAAGLGMMSTPGNFGTGIGKGGLIGLGAYDKAIAEDRQMKALENTQAYRTSMSQAALTRAEALAGHYSNVDNSVTVDRTGDTLRLIHHNGEVVDTGLPNNAQLTREQMAKYAKERADNASRDTFTYQNVTGPDGKQQVVRLSTHGGPATVMPDMTLLSGKNGGAGGATSALVAQLIKDGTAKDTQSALAIIHDPTGRYKGQVNAGLERIAASSAQKDPAFLDNPGATTAKWREYYGIVAPPSATPAPVQTSAPAAPPAPAPIAPQRPPVPQAATGSSKIQYNPQTRQYRWLDRSGKWATQ